MCSIQFIRSYVLLCGNVQYATCFIRFLKQRPYLHNCQNYCIKRKKLFSVFFTHTIVHCSLIQGKKATWATLTKLHVVLGVCYVSTSFIQTKEYCRARVFKLLSTSGPLLLFPYTQKNFATEKSLFVPCTEDIYKFVSPRKHICNLPTRGGRGTRKSLFVSASNSLVRVWGGISSGAALQISDETFRNYFSYLNKSETFKRLDT